MKCRAPKLLSYPVDPAIEIFSRVSTAVFGYCSQTAFFFFDVCLTDPSGARDHHPSYQDDQNHRYRSELSARSAYRILSDQAAKTMVSRVSRIVQRPRVNTQI